MEPYGQLHPGINFHKTPVSGGAAGLLFAVFTVLLFGMGIPGAWWFLGGALAFGLCFAGAVHLFHQRVSATPEKLLKLS
jgi:hypothetical protein